MSDKPTLGYVEYHVVEHCNLNCRGCAHFSPLAPKSYADPAAFDRDLTQLASLFASITKLRLMGGEPLLHPKVHEFILTARKRAPGTNIGVITNGALLRKIGQDFWAACRQADILLEVSLYPSMQASRAKLEALCSKEGVRSEFFPTSEFGIPLNPRGDSDPREALRVCRSFSFCPFLHNSKMYVCAMPATVHYFNTHFGKEIPGGGGLDIFTPGLAGQQVLDHLHTPGHIHAGMSDPRTFPRGVRSRRSRRIPASDPRPPCRSRSRRESPVARGPG